MHWITAMPCWASFYCLLQSPAAMQIKQWGQMLCLEDFHPTSSDYRKSWTREENLGEKRLKSSISCNLKYFKRAPEIMNWYTHMVLCARVSSLSISCVRTLENSTHTCKKVLNLRKQTHELEEMLPIRRKKLQAEKTCSLQSMKDISEGERSTELTF